ncbi:hypothetical protein F5Y11DRAFT_346768 [Daldinia sp. FL1419]|nr:hypothetical protein F5Y11DRAFT_346768 [Daldinia sp. FL1419]
MSKSAFNQADDKPSGDSPAEAPEGPVLKDDEDVEDPVNQEDADSDKQLARNEAEVIDEGNILKKRTRHEKPKGSYAEPSDEDLGLTEGA